MFAGDENPFLTISVGFSSQDFIDLKQKNGMFTTFRRQSLLVVGIAILK
jgi:hypothetical protein